MELDDFKKTKIQSPGSDKENISAEIQRIRNLIEADFKKQKRIAGIFTVFLIFLAMIYMSLFRKDSDLSNIGITLLSVGFLLGATYIYFKSKLISPSFYNLPLVEFLSSTERRLKYMKTSDYLIVIPLLALLGSGGGLFLTSRLLRYTSNMELLILIWIVFFISISIFGFWAGKKEWIKEHGALLEEIRKIKCQFLESTDQGNS